MSTVMEKLLEGNAEYLKGKVAEATTQGRRTDLVQNGQHPIAAVIVCSDSRVAPETIFTVGVGTIFVIRNAGNVPWGNAAAGSIEYAVDHLKVPLVVVLGHSSCGAVGAAVSVAAKGAVLPNGPLKDHVDDIVGVVGDAARAGADVNECVNINVTQAVKNLRSSEDAVGKLIQSNGATVVGAVYDLESGAVNVIV